VEQLCLVKAIDFKLATADYYGWTTLEVLKNTRKDLPTQASCNSNVSLLDQQQLKLSAEQKGQFLHLAKTGSLENRTRMQIAGGKLLFWQEAQMELSTALLYIMLTGYWYWKCRVRIRCVVVAEDVQEILKSIMGYVVLLPPFFKGVCHRCARKEIRCSASCWGSRCRP
jgi:hypothetical protein